MAIRAIRVIRGLDWEGWAPNRAVLRYWLRQAPYFGVNGGLVMSPASDETDVAPMPSKGYRIWMNESTYITVDFHTLEGEVLAFVVRLVHIISDEDYDVARFDTAHGRPHCDLLSPRGRLRRKTWLDDLNFNEALTYAIEDFKANYATYLQEWR